MPSVLTKAEVDGSPYGPLTRTGHAAHATIRPTEGGDVSLRQQPSCSHGTNLRARVYDESWDSVVRACAARRRAGDQDDRAGGEWPVLTSASPAARRTSRSPCTRVGASPPVSKLQLWWTAPIPAAELHQRACRSRRAKIATRALKMPYAFARTASMFSSSWTASLRG